jgi:phosphoribosylamine---glycine ligase
MKVLIVGEGGREHALVAACRRSSRVTSVYCAPGNAGTLVAGINVPLPVTDIEGIASFAENEAIDLTIVGPELPLSLGIVDAFQKKGLRIFGPTQSAAQIESSKAFSKAVMDEAGVPTPRARAVGSSKELDEAVKGSGVPVVLKLDSLAAGKGVFVCTNEHQLSEARERVSNIFREGGSVLVEEYIEGVEASLIVGVGKGRVVVFPSSHDYKRRNAGNSGPNTGGMGSVSPTPNLSDAQERFAIDQIIIPVLHTLSRRGIEFSGFLYAGLMIPNDGTPRVIEFNARFGDPECQPVMLRVDEDIIDIIDELMDGNKNKGEWTTRHIKSSSEVVVCVVHSGATYPEKGVYGEPLVGATPGDRGDGMYLYHASTRVASQSDTTAVTNGGRILGACGKGASLTQAIERAYALSRQVTFSSQYFRTDIGLANNFEKKGLDK